MTPQLNLDEIDVDGAIRDSRAEAEQALQGDTRLSFLRKAGVAGGAAVGGGAILGALAPSALASGRPPRSLGTGDVAILRYALTLEYLEAAFYNEAHRHGAARDPQTIQFLNTVVHDENTHVKLLRAALGSKKIKSPKFNFGQTTRDPATFQATSYVLENTGVHAYLGQAPNIASSKILLTAASIVTIEARHAGAIAVITGQQIAPSKALDTGFSASKVLAAVKKTHFIVK